MEQKIFGDYVLTPVRNAFNKKTSWWMSKKGFGMAMYCFTADTEAKLKPQLAEKASYIRLFKQRVEQATEKNTKEAFEQYKLRWMLEHGHSLEDLIRELDKFRESQEDASIEETFKEWELNRGFGSEIWACYREFLDCDYTTKGENE